jgi:uncharacterized protein YbjT (DUF2867 family)
LIAVRVLLLGAYGLIGSAIARKLTSSGHQVTGVGRNLAKAKRLLPELSWLQGDLNKLLGSNDWHPYLANIDVIINAAGALQTGFADNLDKVQHGAIKALIEAAQAADVKKFIQISAPGAASNATTEFLRTKGHADTWLKNSALHWIIFRPGLVISPDSYGGTTLLRMLGAAPGFIPLCRSEAQIQTVDVNDVTKAVVIALERDDLWQQQYDLLSSQKLSLREVVNKYRRWLGRPELVSSATMPEFICHRVAAGADIAGWLGWRSPLRSTSLQVLANNVRGDASLWQQSTGQSFLNLADSLARIPATQQERSFAAHTLLFPFALMVLAAYWLLTGMVGLWQWPAAAAHLPISFAPQLVWLLGLHREAHQRAVAGAS